MNERIEELAEQSGLEYNFDPMTWLKYEKFAQLIVEECVAQCWTVSEMEHKGNVISECSKRMRKHFGVE